MPNNTYVVHMTLTASDGAVLPGTITPGAADAEGTIIFYNAPKGSTSLTGAVSLVLAKGAQVEGEKLHNTQKTYNTSATSITVRAEDGMTTKTYNISVAAYNAEANPYGLYTPAQLHAVRSALTASYRLMRDVTLPDAGFTGCTKPTWAQDDYCNAGWSPIGTYTSSTSNAPFTGTFDGNGNAIKNLFIGRSTLDNVGLFGYVGASGAIRDLGVHIAATGVTGDDFVGGLVGRGEGAVSNCYATGAVSGSSKVGGLVGVAYGAVSNCYATGTVSGSGDKVGGLVGERAVTVTHSYYPFGRPMGQGGTGMPSGAAQANFVRFRFGSSVAAVWKWVNGQWPQLKNMGTTQTTPSLLVYHTAAAATPSTTGFTMTLQPPLSGLTEDDWALYDGRTAVPLTGVTTADNGGSYTFTATLTANTSYNLLYTKPDAIVVPSPPGHITVTVP